MRPFESFLADKMEEFLAYRQTLGYSQSARTSLLVFDRYLQEKQFDWQDLHPGLFLEFQARFKREPNTANALISHVRSFFQFLVRQEVFTTNPLQDIPKVPKKPFIPYVFTPEQVDQLLAAVSKRLRKSKRFYLPDLALYVAMVLIARCGLRVSEPLRLKRHHYRDQEGTIYIEKTKFKKDRLIPVPKIALRELDNYLAVRDTFQDDNPYLLMGEKGKSISSAKIYRFFYPAIKDIGLELPKQTLGDVTFSPPRIHSLRHSFAINTLKAIKERGQDVQHALPVLAAYMGHRKYQYTGAYLKVLDAGQRQGLIDFARSQELK